MSLTGNLEDLPLLDILQIVSFSKKTGYLTIQAEEGQGAIVFHDGLVVSAFTWESLPVDPRIATLSDDRRIALIKNRIVMALERLTRLREGQFSFALVDDLPRAVGAREIVLETLPVGINPQEMLLDLARGLDEDRRDSTAALEASFADVPVEALGEPAAVSEDDQVEEAGDSIVATFVREATAETLPTLEAEAGPETPVRDDSATVALAPASAPPPPAPAPAKAGPPPPPPVEAPPSPPPRTVLLVDDEDDVRGIIGGLFRIVGYEVIEAEDPESAVKAARTLHKAGTAFLLLVDLGMPATGGSSFQGGFEVVKRLGKMHRRPPVLMMTDSLNPGLRARARQMGISSFVFKPGLSKLDRKQFEADLRAFATRLVQDILPSIGRGGDASRRTTRLAGSESAATVPATAADLSRELGLLQERLAELRKQS